MESGRHGHSRVTDTELEGIQRIWAAVVEDFAPFNVNVTTEEPPLADLINSGGGDTRWGVRTIISSNDPLNSELGESHTSARSTGILIPPHWCLTRH